MATSSLPHRQLRNTKVLLKQWPLSSLPHRQLRNFSPAESGSSHSSLPHRQLRKNFLLASRAI
ncbi:TPA: hypothetical protein I8Z92_003003 [Legionella pneumophila]|nr:hypothetical protein [Legionella pneumophila]